MLHLNTFSRGPAHHDAALPEQALCGLGFGEHHVAELDLSLAITNPSVNNKSTRLDKVNRCLARYSPRATTINRPTNRAPKKPAWPGPN